MPAANQANDRQQTPAEPRLAHDAMGAKVRLDRLLVARGLAATREQARRQILGGGVRVAGEVAVRPGLAVAPGAALEIAGEPEPYVSRAGRKLAAALAHFGLEVAGHRCCDVGASTGGFVDCLLCHGASEVWAVDVGHGQLAPSLAGDPRVHAFEGVNARHLPADFLPRPCSLLTADLSFISLAKVVPALVPQVAPGGHLLLLVKPQFEAGPGLVGKGGLVRDESLRRQVVVRVVEQIAALGPESLGTFDSPLAGSDGNRETFALFARRPA